MPERGVPRHGHAAGSDPAGIAMVVPVSAREVARWLKRMGATYEMKIYPGQGHVFRGPARTDSFQRSADFLARHLQAEERVEETSAARR
jgi:hypothetical protein